jgi:hypothetical protein
MKAESPVPTEWLSKDELWLIANFGHRFEHKPDKALRVGFTSSAPTEAIYQRALAGKTTALEFGVVIDKVKT